MTESESDEWMTLDPPGTITVVGAGALGIEAALYGRFLGYDVTLIEAESVGANMRSDAEAPLPMLPDRCLSPLAISALDAQSQDTEQRVLPMTIGQWIDQALVPLTESDLLAGRLLMPARVVEINSVSVAPEQEQEQEGDVEPIPADFRLKLDRGDTIDSEALVLAIGNSPPISSDFSMPAPYCFRIGQAHSGNAEQDLHLGLREIVQMFAELAGRSDLDLYRPRRH